MGCSCNNVAAKELKLVNEAKQGKLSFDLIPVFYSASDADIENIEFKCSEVEQSNFEFLLNRYGDKFHFNAFYLDRVINYFEMAKYGICVIRMADFFRAELKKFDNLDNPKLETLAYNLGVIARSIEYKTGWDIYALLYAYGVDRVWIIDPSLCSNDTERNAAIKYFTRYMGTCPLSKLLTN